MKFVLLELQVNANGELGILVSDYSVLNQAKSSFHTVMANAELSELPKHGAVLMDEEGNQILAECCFHGDGYNPDKFIVLEIQVNDDESIGTLNSSFVNQFQAESAYYTVLASAAISALPKHSAVILTDSGNIVTSRCYKH